METKESNFNKRKSKHEKLNQIIKNPENKNQEREKKAQKKGRTRKKKKIRPFYT